MQSAHDAKTKQNTAARRQSEVTPGTDAHKIKCFEYESVQVVMLL